MIVIPSDNDVDTRLAKRFPLFGKGIDIVNYKMDGFVLSIRVYTSSREPRAERFRFYFISDCCLTVLGSVFRRRVSGNWVSMIE